MSKADPFTDSSSYAELGLEILMTPFASSITAKAIAVRTLTLPTRVRRRFLESISEDIKKATTLHPHEVSEAARAHAASLGVADLTTMTWHEQHTFDPGRALFLVEHMVPVSAIAHACIQQADSLSAVLAILIELPRVVWVLRAEDRTLTRLGFRKNRPDPEAAYRLAGITVAAARRARAS